MGLIMSTYDDQIGIRFLNQLIYNIPFRANVDMVFII